MFFILIIKTVVPVFSGSIIHSFSIKNKECHLKFAIPAYPSLYDARVWGGEAKESVITIDSACLHSRWFFFVIFLYCR